MCASCAPGGCAASNSWVKSWVKKSVSNKCQCVSMTTNSFGGGSGIRTRDTVSRIHRRVPSPLGHPSAEGAAPHDSAVENDIRQCDIGTPSS